MFSASRVAHPPLIFATVRTMAMTSGSISKYIRDLTLSCMSWARRVPGVLIEAAKREHLRRKERFAGWRMLVAASTKARANAEDYDPRLAAAMVADAAHLLDLKLSYLLAVRMLAKGDAFWPDAGHDAKLIARLMVAKVRAGHWMESVRLAEHSGALAAFGSSTSIAYDKGLQAALEGERTVEVPLLGKRREVPASLLFDVRERLERHLGWMPHRVLDEVFALSLIMLESMVFGRSTEIVWRGGDAAGLSDNIFVNLYRRTFSSARLSVSEGTTRLILGLKGGEILYRASFDGHSREGMLGFVAGWTWTDDAIPVRARDVFYSLLDFHMLSRQKLIDELLEPLTLLRIGGRVVHTALDCLQNRPLSGDLTITAKGLLAAMPWPAVWNGWSHLVEEFDICVDDGLPNLSSDRPPSLAALYGTSAAMAEEATLVVAEARDRGFSAADPLALTTVSLADALAHATIVHVAAHMSAHPRDPGRARLQLANGEWIDVAEFAPASAGVELLFLASCESGIVADNEAIPGRDGTRPWREAGVASVISTLWRINDRHSTILVRGFYERLFRGETRAGALAGIQREMLRGMSSGGGRTAERFIDLIDDVPSASPADDPAHPRVWGAFRLTGAGGRIRGHGQAGTGSIPSMNP